MQFNLCRCYWIAWLSSAANDPWPIQQPRCHQLSPIGCGRPCVGGLFYFVLQEQLQLGIKGQKEVLISVVSNSSVVGCGATRALHDSISCISVTQDFKFQPVRYVCQYVNTTQSTYWRSINVYPYYVDFTNSLFKNKRTSSRVFSVIWMSKQIRLLFLEIASAPISSIYFGSSTKSGCPSISTKSDSGKKAASWSSTWSLRRLWTLAALEGVVRCRLGWMGGPLESGNLNFETIKKHVWRNRRTGFVQNLLIISGTIQPELSCGFPVLFYGFNYLDGLWFSVSSIHTVRIGTWSKYWAYWCLR